MLFLIDFDNAKIKEDAVALSIRWLQSSPTNPSVGRTVLIIMYLTVLGFCFIVPFCYYARMRCVERRDGTVFELHGEATNAADGAASREERRAMRRKYRENKRALVLQLFAPVSMKLTENHFSHLRDKTTKKGVDEKDTSEKRIIDAQMGTDDTDSTPDEVSSHSVDSSGEEKDAELGEGAPSPEKTEANRLDSSASEFDELYAEENTFIEIPEPGLRILDDSLEKEPSLRWVPNLCVICLANYEVGDEVVWSSNAACEHCFHVRCAEKWLVKQRGASLCPCCRRDFVVDPYEAEEESSLAVLSHEDETGTIVSPEESGNHVQH